MLSICLLFGAAVGRPLFDVEREVSLTSEDFAGAKLLPKNSGFPNLTEILQNQTGFFEGDLLNLNPDSVDPYVEMVNAGMAYSGLERNALRAVHFLWPQATVPYMISSRFSPHDRQVIASAFQEYRIRTCIRFVPGTNHRDYVFIRPGNGCASSVGRQGGRQELFLGPHCIRKGIILHELMHVVGFFHEQSRADRDSFVEILWQNIQFGMEGNFKKFGLDVIRHLGVSYDFDSLMHYGPFSFTTNGQQTIRPRPNGVRIGQQVDFSVLDLIKLNRLYNCGSSSGNWGNVIMPI